MDGHSGWVWSLAYNPEGNLLASSAGDNTIRLWDVSLGVCMMILRGHSLDVYSIAFSPDGALLASGSEDSTIRIWGARSGECLKTLRAHSAFVHGVAFSPDGKFLASGSGDKTCRIWDVETGNCVYTLAGHTGSVLSVAFSPDGEKVASGSSDNTVKIWDIKNSKLLKSLTGHTAPVRCVAYNSSGALIASGSSDNSIILWRAEKGEKMGALTGHAGYVEAVSFTPDGLKLISASDDRTIRVWSVSSGKCTQTLKKPEKDIVSVAVTRDGSKFATGSCDNKIYIWRRARMYKYTSYYKMKIGDQKYEVVEVEYPGQPRGKVVIDQEGNPVKDRDIVNTVLNAGDMIGFCQDPDYRSERFKYFIAAEVMPRKEAFNTFANEIPNTELISWWRNETYPSQIMTAVKSAFLIGSDMAKKIKTEIPEAYVELAVEKFTKDPVTFFIALCQDIIFDGMQRMVWLEEKCNDLKNKDVINIDDFQQIEDAFWDAVVYASAMDYTYSKMEDKIVADLITTMKNNMAELTQMAKPTGKSTKAGDIGAKFGTFLSKTMVYSEYHKEAQRRWELKQRELIETWRKERTTRAIDLATIIIKGL
jgi:WD40 repeat protein